MHASIFNPLFRPFVQLLQSPFSRPTVKLIVNCCMQLAVLCGCRGVQSIGQEVLKRVLTDLSEDYCNVNEIHTTLDKWEWFSFVRCFLQELIDGSNETCTRQCVPPCWENIYKSSVTVSGPWPHSVYLNEFYSGYIRGSYVENHFNEVVSLWIFSTLRTILKSWGEDCYMDHV